MSEQTLPPLKLRIIRRGDDLLLALEDGRVIPGQRDVMLQQPLDKPQLVTVTFVINGDSVKFSDEPWLFGLVHAAVRNLMPDITASVRRAISDDIFRHRGPTP